MTWERITAADVRVGDRIARTRNDEPRTVLELAPGAKSVYVTLEHGRGDDRIRPRWTTKLWRAEPEYQEQEPPSPQVIR